MKNCLKVKDNVTKIISEQRIISSVSFTQKHKSYSLCNKNFKICLDTEQSYDLLYTKIYFR